MTIGIVTCSNISILHFIFWKVSFPIHPTPLTPPGLSAESGTLTFVARNMFQHSEFFPFTQMSTYAHSRPERDGRRSDPLFRKFGCFGWYICNYIYVPVQWHWHSGTAFVGSDPARATRGLWNILFSFLPINCTGNQAAGSF